MLENSEENQNNFEENFESMNRDDIDNNQNIQLNPNRKKILPNRNQEKNDSFDDQYNNDNYNQNVNSNDYNMNENNDKNDFNGYEENGNNDMNQPKRKFYYDNERNVTEEISKKTMVHLNKYLEKIGKYFNVELSDLKMKLKGAIIPFNKSFYQSIEINSDLYGPFWILTSIIFLITVVGNFSSYLNAEDKEKYAFNYNHVPHAVFIFYGFGFGVPFILWIISKLIFKIDIDLLTNMCIYGYSYTILIPILLICMIPIKLVRTLALIYFLVHSCIFLFYNMILIIQQKAPKTRYIILGIIGGIQFILFFLLKFYFF